MFRIGRVNGQGGELERGKPFVRAEQVRWHGRQQKMAARPTRGADKPRVKPVVTLRRDVGNEPLERTTPPSEASKNSPLLLGFTTSACWSGCMPFGATNIGG